MFPSHILNIIGKFQLLCRGCLEKIFIVLLLQLETFTVKLRIFRKRKMPLTYIGNLTAGFTRFLRKKLPEIFQQSYTKRKSDYCQTSFP